MMPSVSRPDVGASLQRVFRTQGVFLLFHLLFASAWFVADVNVFHAFCVWFVFQLGVHAGYHRYFSHGSFRTHRWMEFALACMGCLAFQNGPLWWASKHRHHHRVADTDGDPHSPIHGFWHAHIGWLWREDVDRIDWRLIPDLCRLIPIWVERYQPGIHFFYVSGVVLAFGWSGLFTYWIIPIVACWHTTFATNSVCHLFGTHPFECRSHGSCSARNNAVVAIINLGEGWHNNHHAYPTCSHHGFHGKHELDIVYLVLLVLEKLKIVWNLKKRTPRRLAP